MRTWMLYGLGAVIVAWIGYRLYGLVRRRLQDRRDRRPPAGLRCPACDSARLDDYSDEESGYCLDCHHVWGVSGRR